MSFQRYESYRESAFEWRGAIPSHWSETRLRFVAAINPSKSEVADLPDETEVSFLPMEAIGEDGSLELSRTRNLGEVRNGYSYFADGDVVFAKVTPCLENGKGAFIEGLLGGRGFGTTELTVLRSRDHDAGRFLWWFTASRAFRGIAEGEMVGAGGLKRVPEGFVANFPLAWPPAAERRTIVNFLDRETAKIDALVEAQRRLIELLKEKRQAVISHAVTKGLDPTAPMRESGIEWLGEVPAHWAVAPLKRFLSVLSGYAFPSTGFSPDAADTRLLRGVNVGVGEVRWEDVVYWQRGVADGLDQWELRTGDIVLGMDRPWIADGLRIAKVSSEDLPSLLLQRVAALRPGEALLPDYLPYLLRGDAFHHHCIPQMTGVSVPHISPTQIGEFMVALPPAEEQAFILKRLDGELMASTRLMEAAELAISLLQERRAALISAAVTGKIDVRQTAPKAEAA